MREGRSIKETINQKNKKEREREEEIDLARGAAGHASTATAAEIVSGRAKAMSKGLLLHLNGYLLYISIDIFALE